MTTAGTRVSARTDWLLVCSATFAGAAAAVQIGKAGAAMPLMRDDLGIGVAEASLYLALISVFVALTGAALGAFASRVGAARAAIGGLLLMGTASLASAAAPTTGLLLVARLFEAAGFPLVVAALPSIVGGAAATRHRGLTLGLWAAWLPLGVAAAMLIAYATLAGLGWRVYFATCALMPLSGALLLILLAPRAGAIRTAGFRLVRPSAATLWVAAVFLCFSAANLIFMGFLPSVLVERMGASASAATLVSFVAALLLVPANVLTGAAASAGANRSHLMIASFAVIAVSACLFLAEGVAPALRLGGAMALAFATGMTPALVWLAVPELAEDAGTPSPAVGGAVYQAAGLGQLVGPVAAGLLVDLTESWFAAAIVITTICGVAILLVLGARNTVGFGAAPVLAE